MPGGLGDPPTTIAAQSAKAMAQVIDRALEARWLQLKLDWNVQPDALSVGARPIDLLLKSCLRSSADNILAGRANPLDEINLGNSGLDGWNPLARAISSPTSMEVDHPFHEARSSLQGMRAIGLWSSPIQASGHWDFLLAGPFSRLNPDFLPLAARSLASDIEALELAQAARAVPASMPARRI